MSDSCPTCGAPAVETSARAPLYRSEWAFARSAVLHEFIEGLTGDQWVIAWTMGAEDGKPLSENVRAALRVAAGVEETT